MPEGNLIRPTPGKVKEAIFSMVGHDLSDNYVLDLFAGTGSLGIEAISRGASFVWLGDKSPDANLLISENLKTTGAGDKARLIRGDWQYVLRTLNREGSKLDIIFLDPPFDKDILEKAIGAISLYELLNEDGIIVAEYDHSLSLPEEIDDLVCFKSKKYGKTIVSLYGYELDPVDDLENPDDKDLESGDD